MKLNVFQSDFVWLPSVTNEGVISWQRSTSATAPSTANIMGPHGNTGDNGTDGTDGTDGISPTFTITPIAGGTRVTISGAQGEEGFDVLSGASGANGKEGANGTDGTDGTDGISPTFTIAPIAGGTHVTISGAQGEEGFDVLSGAKGTDGAAGFSPTIALTPVNSDASHNNGGTQVEITYKNGESTANTAYTAWNGNDGEGASVDLFGNNGVSVTKDGTSYTLGLSGGYYSNTLSAYSAMYASYASYAKFSDNSVSSMDHIKGSIDWGNQIASEYATRSGNFVTSSSQVITGDKQYGLTTTGWAEIDTGTSFTGVTAAGSITGDGLNSPLGLITSAENALAAVANKVDLPDTTQSTINNKYLGYSTLTSEGQVTGWFDLSNKFYSKSEAGNTFVKTTAYNADKATFVTTGDMTKYLPLSGGNVSGSTYFSAANGQTVIAVASAATLIGASRQTSENFGQNVTSLGTTWIGVGGPGMYRGFLKYTQDGNVGALDSINTMQVEFTPNKKGTIFAKAKNDGTACPETQILNPTKDSCDAMVQSANANFVSGPNYMLAKNADGQFVIGAACINCTAISDVTLSANTYYFVYEV